MGSRAGARAPGWVCFLGGIKQPGITEGRVSGGHRGSIHAGVPGGLWGLLLPSGVAALAVARGGSGPRRLRPAEGGGAGRRRRGRAGGGAATTVQGHTHRSRASPGAAAPLCSRPGPLRHGRPGGAAPLIPHTPESRTATSRHHPGNSGLCCPGNSAPQHPGSPGTPLSPTPPALLRNPGSSVLHRHGNSAALTAAPGSSGIRYSIIPGIHPHLLHNPVPQSLGNPSPPPPGALAPRDLSSPSSREFIPAEPFSSVTPHRSSPGTRLC